MLSHCLNCKKIQKAYIQGFQKPVKVKQCYRQNVPYAVIKNQDLLKITKQVEYYVIG